MRKLHIPYKFSLQQRNFDRVIRPAVVKNTGRFDQPVTAGQLSKVLNDAFENIGQQQRQDWLEIERWAAALDIPGAAATFNATIDSAQTVADPVNHIYPNLHSLVANESWSNTFVLHVYMVNRPDSPVIETSATTMPGPMVLEGPGIGTQADSNYATLSTTVGGRALWDFQGAVVTNTDMLHIKNITMFRSIAGTQTQLFTGPLVLENCFFNGLFSGTTKIARPNGGVHWGLNSIYSGVPQFVSNTFWMECHLGVSAGASFTLCTQEFMWLGGTIELVNSGAAFTMTIGNNAVIKLSRNANNTVFSSSISGDIPIALTTGKSVYFECAQKTGNTIALTVPAGMAQLILRGFFGVTTVGAGANNSSIDVDITMQGTSTMNGPGIFKINMIGTTTRLTFQGTGILGEVFGDFRGITPLAGTMLSLVGCINSNIRCTLIGTGSTVGGQAFAIDAASGPGIFAISGRATFPLNPPGANASATVQVFDEVGVHNP